MSYRRSFAVERASVNEETGEFRAVLFTDGEASDGHILNIAGGRIPDQMPLFVNHQADPREQLGSLYPDRATPHQVRVRGQVFVDGDGAQAEIRRDILAKMAAGHVSRMSGRWDAEADDVKRRSDLPTDHPAHVGEKVRGRKRYGLFFEKWVAQEGSVVGLGADPQATMRWAEEAESDAVASFWRSQSEELDESDALEPDDEEIQSTEAHVEREDSERAESAVQEEPEPAPKAAEPPTREAIEASAAAYLREIAGSGQITAEELRALANETLAPEPTPEERLSQALERIDALERKLGERDDLGCVQGEPAPPNIRTTKEIFDYLDAKLRAADEKALAMLQAVINVKRGKVTEGQTRQQRLEAEARGLLDAMRLQRKEQNPAMPDLGPTIVELESRLENARRRLQKTLRVNADAASLGSKVYDAAEVPPTGE